MDSPKVEMLRSVKGKDMLLINDYLYHYDDRNSKAYRWVCSRRKDKIPCRVKIYTSLIDEWDLTRHKLENIVGEHPHAPAEPESILRAREKKRQADAEGLPCTLSNKSLKRKYQRKEEEEKKTAIKKKKISGEEISDTSNDEEETNFNELIALDTPKEKEEKSVLMLKTSKGYHMVAVEGCVYRLDGKSMFSCTYRWKCFRSKDLQCTGRIYTECLANGMHRFKHFRVEENKHNHQPYSKPKIEALIKRNNIKILQGSNENLDKKVEKSPGVVKDNTKAAKVVKAPKTPPLSVRKGGGNVLSISANINVSPRPSLRRERASATAALYKQVQNPYDALTSPKEGRITKFFFLPSLKGNRILVMDYMIFHYDSRGSVNDRAYWTCLYRRDKNIKCNCRLTTEHTETNTQIVKVSGAHTHEKTHREQIEKRINMDWTIKDKKNMSMKKENETFLENDNSLYKTTDDEENDDHDNKEYNENNDEYGNEISEFLKIKPMKKENDTKRSIEYTEDFGSNQEISIVECKTEMDPFYETIEYVEMERINASQYQGDYETERDDEDNTHRQVSTRPKRKIKKSSRYNSDSEGDGDDEEYTPQKVTKKQKMPTLTRGTYKKMNISYNPDNIDITKTSKLRSAKGGELLCVDGYIYHLKSVSHTTRTYWACIKSKDRRNKCLARVTTVTTDDNKLKVVHLSNSHTHGVSEADIKKRLFNEFSKSSSSKTDLKSKDIMDKSLSELNPEFAEMLTKPRRLQSDRGNPNMKLYAVSDGPPSLAVRMCLKALNLNYELHNVDYIASEHMSEEYAKMNPQKEIPVLDDDGFFLPESIAIMQYLCDKYAPNGTTLYPKDPKERALVNHRLCFNMGFYYSSIGAYSMAPIFFDYQRTEMGLKKVNNALQVFETYLQRLGTKYAAGEHLTIADFGLISATLCLEAIGFDLSPFPLITKWYENFKSEHKDLWDIANGGMQEIKEFEANPPDLSHMNHPFHPTRKSKA